GVRIDKVLDRRIATIGAEIRVLRLAHADELHLAGNRAALLRSDVPDDNARISESDRVVRFRRGVDIERLALAGLMNDLQAILPRWGRELQRAIHTGVAVTEWLLRIRTSKRSDVHASDCLAGRILY